MHHEVKKTKTGILTWHYMDNFGGVLQCWALKRALEVYGCDVQVLNYLPKKLQTRVPWWRGWGFRRGRFFENLPKRILGLTLGRASWRKFDQFRETRLNLTSPVRLPKEVAELAADFDLVITGSDQVWRFPEQRVYFLDLGTGFGGRKISYAACCGSPAPIGHFHGVGQLLRELDAVSVRNRFSNEAINALVERDVPIVADPTLLVDLKTIQKPIRGLSGPYIVTYIMGSEIDGGHLKVIEAIRRKHGDLPVISIAATAQCPQFFSFADRELRSVGPEEWIWLLANAAFIYTDSFHATLFAARNCKPLLAYFADESRGDRFVDVSGRYELAGSIATSAAEAVKKIATAPNWVRTSRLIEAHVAESLEFIETAVRASRAGFNPSN